MKKNQQPEFNFEIFKQQFLLFIRKEYCVNCSFNEEIEKSETVNMFKWTVRKYSEEIAEHIGVSLDDKDCDGCDKLQTEVEELKYELENFDLPTMADEMRYESFQKYHENYGAVDFDYLLEHGHELLKQALVKK